jgi:hypothetical protein
MLLAGYSAVILGAGYAAGRFTAPDKVVDRTETFAAELAAAKSEAVSLRSRLAEVSKQIHRERVSVRAPDGTVTTTTKTDVKVDSTTRTEEAAATKAETTKATAVAASTTHTVERERPSVRVGLLGGLNTRGALVGGLHGEGRLVGPLSVGGWVISDLKTEAAAGVSLSLEF